jgi:hypothetical protein
MSQLDLRQKDSNPDKVYYDLTIANLNNGDVNAVNSPYLIFNEQRQNSIIPNTGDYYMSIVRFQLDTSSLPIFVPIIQLGQSDPNATIYSVTVVNNTTGALSQVYIEWVNQIKNQDVLEPPPPNPVQAESEWYFCYSFEWFVNLVNTALSTALSNVGIIPYPTPPVPPATNGLASMAWNASSNTATLYLDEANFYTPDAGTVPAGQPKFSLYFNQALFTLFSSFPAEYLGSVGVTNGMNYKIQVYNYSGINTIQLPVTAPSINCIYINQEWDTTGVWTPVSSIVFTSATFPIIPTRLSPPQAFLNGVLYNLSSSGNNSNVAQVITDLASGDLCYKPSLLYEPTAQFRLIDMVGNTPLTNINIQVFWKSKLGNFVPFRLATGNSCSMKLLFTKKSSVSNNANQ